MWLFALVAGIVAAVIDTATMIPLEFPSTQQKRQAMTAAFIDRFFLGFIVGPVASGLDTNGLLIGAFLGIGTSVGTAIITKTWAPIVIMGLLTGIGVGIGYELIF
ncbi:MAG: hypothetical protein Q8Q52_03690 [Acidimicrobiia bacterium]|nr:hypothetical protein [Acidimicrobiia bacterium]